MLRKRHINFATRRPFLAACPPYIAVSVPPPRLSVRPDVAAFIEKVGSHIATVSELRCSREKIVIGTVMFGTLNGIFFG